VIVETEEMDMAMKTNKFDALTTEQLKVWWTSIDLNPGNRVQSGPNKGLLKMSAIRKGHEVLAEIHRRRDMEIVR
jgi:hypothetical protein